MWNTQKKEIYFIFSEMNFDFKGERERTSEENEREEWGEEEDVEEEVEEWEKQKK